MPDWDGIEVILALENFVPHTKVLIVSAFLEEHIADLKEKPNIAGWFAKPISVDRFKKKVISLLSEES